MHSEGTKLGMVNTDEVVLNGMTGSIPGKREDLEQLLQRKRDKDDFDVLLVQRIDRATRGGSKHGFWLEHECDRHGIILHYVGEDLPENPEHAAMIKALKYESARDQAKSIGQRSTQGFLHALSQSRVLTVSNTPFGCDRLYLSADGVPQYRIRPLPDGTQQKLDVEGNEVLERFGTKSRFRKQKEQMPLIVPGAPDAADAVRMMFDLHYNERWGGRRIAVELNERGILSPKGREWSQRQVESIYENPIYCGVALGGVKSQGIFYQRGKTGPERVNVSAHDLASLKGAPRRLRPPEEWVWTELPQMAGFLPEVLREKALSEIRRVHIERYRRSEDPDRPKRSTNKHKNSQYVLTGLLEAKQDGGRLTGTLTGRVGKKKRKYRHPKSKLGVRRNSIYNRYIDAQSLEDAVLAMILQVARDAPDMRLRLAKALESINSASADESRLAQLQQQREDIAKQFQRITLTMTEEDQADIKPALDKLRAQRRSVEAQIEKFSGRVGLSSMDPHAIIDAVMGRLANLPDQVDYLDEGARRDLIEAFVVKVIIDLETKNAEVILRLPPWAFKSASGAAEEGRLVTSRLSSVVYETPPLLTVFLGKANCQYEKGHRSVCYRCRRRVA